MSQQDILKFLEANPKKFFSAKEIAQKLDMELSAASKKLGRLRGTSWIQYKTAKYKLENQRLTEMFVYSSVNNVS